MAIFHLPVTSNEINLLNRIKSLEANDGYSRAEVDRCLTKEKESQEIQQRLQYRIECLQTELDNANRVCLNYTNNCFSHFCS